MTLLLKQLFAFLKLLNSDKGTNQIAAGLACGLILGFTPVFSLQTLLVFICAFVFRIQLGAALLAAFFFKFVAYLFDPAFDIVGSQVLETESLRPLFTYLYNLPIVPFTRFNNSIVMGSGIVTVVLAPIMFFVFRYLVVRYRELVVARLKGSKAWKVMQATAFYKWYVKYEDLTA